MPGLDNMQELLAQLLAGMGDSGSPPPTSQSEQQDTSRKKEPESENPFGGIDLETILKMGELFSQLSQDDKNTQLLMALKPHLRNDNQKKLDQAVKMLKLMSLLPMLKEMGIMGDIF